MAVLWVQYNSLVIFSAPSRVKGSYPTSLALMYFKQNFLNAEGFSVVYFLFFFPHIPLSRGYPRWQ